MPFVQVLLNHTKTEFKCRNSCKCTHVWGNRKFVHFNCCKCSYIIITWYMWCLKANTGREFRNTGQLAQIRNISTSSVAVCIQIQRWKSIWLNNNEFHVWTSCKMVPTSLYIIKLYTLVLGLRELFTVHSLHKMYKPNQLWSKLMLICGRRRDRLLFSVQYNIIN